MKSLLLSLAAVAGFALSLLLFTYYIAPSLTQLTAVLGR